MTTQLVQAPKPKQAKGVHGLTWEQLEEIDRSLADFPGVRLAPDLVLEVVISSGGVNKLKGYRRVGVTEVWFWEDGVLQLHHCRAEGYERLNHSELLPRLPIDLFRRYITYHDQYDAVREFRQALCQSFE